MSDLSARPRTRDSIFAAATRLFAERGFAGTTVRDIASATKVDPALVIRHFGSKEALFLETMRLEFDRGVLFDGPADDLGVRYIRMLLQEESRVKSVFLAMVRASDSEGIGSRLREAHEKEFVGPLVARLAGPEVDLRARLAASLVGGLLYSLWIVGDDALATADHETIAITYGALLQQLISPRR